ncbi:hypothetical protein [Actinophytocola sp.]|uniref:hypothetical protein n=1 Tax=Actinophytocola sp. TaxID=1872138 RepID=UPI002ED2AB88
MTSKNTPSGAEGLGIWGGLGIWIAFGALVGVVAELLYNVALGIALGPALGVAAWAVFIAPRRNTRDES